MINVEEFLLKSNLEVGTYALVTYDNKTEATWFTKYDNCGDDGHTWFLESPCQLMKYDFENQSEQDIKDFVLAWYGDECLESDIDYVKSMVRGDYLYEIENFQCSPYLPKEVDDITLITEQECLDYILQQNKIDKE
jgi:hypothetical protein